MEPVLLAQTTSFILKPLAWLFSLLINLIYNGVVAITTPNALGITIILFTLIVKALLFPLSLKQQRSTRKMQRLQPKMQRIQDKYKDKKDPESQRMMQSELSELYRENKTSPLSGCLPLLIQLPLIFALYEILRNTAFYITNYGAYFDTLSTQVMNLSGYEGILTNEVFANAMANVTNFNAATVDSVKDLLSHFTADNWNSFFGLAPTLAANAGFKEIVNTTQLLNNFIGFNLTENAGLAWPGITWPILAAVTTWLQSWLMNKANDRRTIAAGGDPKKSQGNTMKMMTYIFPIMTAFFVINMPLGIGLYWIATNVFSIFQQLLMDWIVDNEEYKEALKRKEELEEKKRLRELTKSSIDARTGKRIGTAEMAQRRSGMAGNRRAADSRRQAESLEQEQAAAQKEERKTITENSDTASEAGTANEEEQK